SALVAASPPRFLYSARMGTKACEKAPSPNRRRSRLGMRKATKKASVSSPAPKMRAIKKSRMNPKTRLTVVKLLTVARARRRFMIKFAPFSRTLNGKYQVGQEARYPGNPPARPQHESAHRGAHRGQERQQGRRRRQEGRGCQGAAGLAARHRPRRGQGRPAPQRRQPLQEPALARDKRDEVRRAEGLSGRIPDA